MKLTWIPTFSGAEYCEYLHYALRTHRAPRALENTCQ